MTMVKGQTVAEDSKAVYHDYASTAAPDQALLDSVKLADPLNKQDFHMPIDSEQQINVIQIIPNQLETRLVQVPAPVAREFEPDTELDLLKIAVVERHKGLKETGLGVVKGFDSRAERLPQPFHTTPIILLLSERMMRISRRQLISCRKLAED